MIDATVAHQAQQPGAGRTMLPIDASPTIAFVKNTTANLVPRGSALGLDAPLVEPATNESTFRRACFAGTTPAAAHLGLFALMLEPVQPGGVGRGIVMGITVAKVHFPEEGFRFADVNIDDPPVGGAPLKAQGYGPVQILSVSTVPLDEIDGGLAWKDPEEGEIDGGEHDTVSFDGEVDGGPADPEEIEDDGVRFCVVRMGNDTRGVDFRVLCTIDGGDAGVAGVSNCSWTYTVTTLDGVLLGEGMTPEERRWPLTPYTSTPANTVGEGYYDVGGAFVLSDANETIGVDHCPESEG